MRTPASTSARDTHTNGHNGHGRHRPDAPADPQPDGAPSEVSFVMQGAVSAVQNVVDRIVASVTELRRQLPVSTPSNEADRKLRDGEWESMTATLNTADLRPRKFEVAKGNTLAPLDTAPLRARLDRYQTLAGARAELEGTMAAIDGELARLGGELRSPLAEIYDVAKAVARKDAMAAATLAPAIAHHHAPNEARKLKNRDERLLEQGMSEAERAARRAERAKARAEAVSARQSARAAKAAKK